MKKIVLHSDMNNYFASVECIDRPELKQVPMAVCGDPAMRHGIVLAKNDFAKKFGIVTGESSADAKKKCRELVIVKPDYTKYLKFAKLARSIYSDYTDKIYPYGMDEAWIDLSDVCGTENDGIKTADEIRNRIKSELGLTASIGVSFNFVFSKLGSDLKKPDATSIISHDDYKSKVWDMPAFNLLFVGAATRKSLQKIGILTIGDIARSDPVHLEKKLGKKGRTLYEFAHGDDSSFDPCANGEEDIKSLGNTITPPRDICNDSDCAAFIYLLSKTVSKRLKKHTFKTNCVSIVIRKSDFNILTRQRSFACPTDSENAIFMYAYSLFRENHNWDSNIRSIGVKADKLSSLAYEQIVLFDFDEDNELFGFDTAALEARLANLKNDYGILTLEQSATSKDT